MKFTEDVLLETQGRLIDQLQTQLNKQQQLIAQLLKLLEELSKITNQ